MSADPLDLVVYGATGFTGRLVAEVLAEQAASESVRWAMAGRSRAKLEAVRDEIGAGADTPLLVADVEDGRSLSELVTSVRCVLSAVGPYTLYGSELVARCAEAGTDYLDLSGEVLWIYEMIERHTERARKSGARIVHSAGFDSVPFDLGVLFLQREAEQRFGSPCSRVRTRVVDLRGGASGGTLMSMKLTLDALKDDPALFGRLANPFSLAGGFRGPEQPPGNEIAEDEVAGGWTAPFYMAPINTKNIHRSNALLGHSYGQDFVYDEMFFTGPGPEGEAAAHALVKQTGAMAGEGAPKPGEGPSRAEREAGGYELLLIGTHRSGGEIRVRVTGDRDPGYGSTSKMIAQCALCLLRDCGDLPGGIYTPAAAFGERLLPRLRERSGLAFELLGASQ